MYVCIYILAFSIFLIVGETAQFTVKVPSFMFTQLIWNACKKLVLGLSNLITNGSRLFWMAVRVPVWSAQDHPCKDHRRTCRTQLCSVSPAFPSPGPQHRRSLVWIASLARNASVRQSQEVSVGLIFLSDLD